MALHGKLYFTKPTVSECGLGEVHFVKRAQPGHGGPHLSPPAWLSGCSQVAFDVGLTQLISLSFSFVICILRITGPISVILRLR